MLKLGGTPGAFLAVLKVCTNADTTVEPNQPESVRQQRKSGVFMETASEVPVHNELATFSVNPGILLSLCTRASVPQPCTCTTTGE